ncbi:hypothetical protein SAMN05428969_0822 [Devosia sp. YR412]|uniref:hypothetical protein n=1 Tax=Devosia sp. YR412 TaxID=1881030 RepID=UPI0008B812EE|nr:hypothetical protein [Devosia sp. YR412]SEP76813.1 hypothetical protein SAMN05428969_0822 [Devosia sp. YR412]
MARDIARYLRIQESRPTGGTMDWRTLPNCEKVPVWQAGTAQRADEDQSQPTTLHIFHIPHIPNLARGHRVLYLGQSFQVAEVSSTSQLLGLELRCKAEI